MDVEAYLARIGHAGPRDATVETLRDLHEAHLAAIPFENLDILLGKSLSLSLDALEDKLVHNRRGGYCFEQNTLFRAALESLGFEVTSLAARVRMGATAIRPRTHMLLRVDVGGAPHIADVGFGGDGSPHPLPLEDGARVGRHQIARESPTTWVLRSEHDGKLTDLYAFTLEPHFSVDFEMANHFTSTYPSSPFVQSLTAQRVLADRRLILRNRDLVIQTETATTNETVRDPDHLLEILREQFTLSFPAGTRFRKPEF